MIITFCGHRNIIDSDGILKKLVECLEPFFCGEEKLIFYCGGYGAFDGLASKAIDILRERYPERAVEKDYITPYLLTEKKERVDYLKERYDEIVYPPLENVPPKFAISRRNEWMADGCDCCIAHVTHDWGGAAKMLQYAKRRHKKIFMV
jgi:hypothetical protein